MEKGRVLVGMSGGVDSSVCALLLAQAGYEVAGATLHLYDNEDVGLERSRTCCSLDDVEDARAVAARLHIPFYVYNFKNDFRTCVMDRFAAEYRAGRTPNPCIECNRFVKFAKLLERANMLGFDAVATGHYARVVRSEKNGRMLLKKGADAGKDQSYMLYRLSQEQLAHLVLPLGEYQKDEIRALAAAKGFDNAKKPDSQDICFIPDGDYVAFLRRAGVPLIEGDFVDESGRVLGRHRGLSAYTTGQRKGLGVGGSAYPLYVLGKDAAANTVILGPEEHLYSARLWAEDLNWVSIPAPTAPLRVRAKTRYSHNEADATLFPADGNGRAELLFDAPQRALTCGQSAVFYDGDTVLGGGTICAVE